MADPAVGPPSSAYRAAGAMSATTEESRRASILSHLTGGDPAASLLQRICEVSVAMLNVSGAGICLIAGARHEVILYGTDPIAASLEDLQLSSAQGPCIEALRSASPVAVPELKNFRSTAWQAYADQALALGVRAVFSFPLQADNAQLGALDLYRTSPGMLDADQIADGLAIVDLATRSILAQQERFSVDPAISALSEMTVADRDPTPVTALGPLDLDITVAQAFGAPLTSGTDRSAGVTQWS